MNPERRGRSGGDSDMDRWRYEIGSVHERGSWWEGHVVTGKKRSPTSKGRKENSE